MANEEAQDVPAPTTAPLAEGTSFRVGSVIERGIMILLRNIVPFGVISCLLMSPTYIYALLFDPDIHLAPGASATYWAADLIDYLLMYVVTAALVYGTILDLRGSRARIGDCVVRGISLALPVIGVSIVAGLLIGVGLLLLVIPGLVFSTMLWVAVPAAVAERLGVTGSLKRSAALTKGSRWRVFATIIILYAIVIGASLLTVFFLRSVESSTVYILGQLVSSAFSTALVAVISAVGYHDLRIAREGIDAEQIAAVFD